MKKDWREQAKKIIRENTEEDGQGYGFFGEEELLAFIEEVEREAEERGIQQSLATIMLWRPYFYDKKVTKDDKEVLKSMLGELGAKHE